MIVTLCYGEEDATTGPVGEEEATTHAPGEEGSETTDAPGEEEPIPIDSSTSSANPFGSF